MTRATPPVNDRSMPPHAITHTNVPASLIRRKLQTWHRLAAARPVRCNRLSGCVSPMSKVLQSGHTPVVAIPAVAGVAREAERAGDGGQHADGPGVEEAAALVALAGRWVCSRQAQPDVRDRLQCFVHDLYFYDLHFD